MEIFVSDIHGNYDTFARILRNIPQDTHVHVVGDIYDRGPAPDKVMDALGSWPSADIQWGNHDILWMGAALGQAGSVANVVRICARYGNLDVLEQIYRIDLGPLRAFANNTYVDDPCAAFGLKGKPALSEEETLETMRIQKAMAYIQFKAEAALIDEHPEFELDARKLLHHIDYKTATLELDGAIYPLTDTRFPTVDPNTPYELTKDETQVLTHLQNAFRACEKLQQHMRILLERGSLYARSGDILLIHACVPFNADGSCKQSNIFGAPLSGRALFDAVNASIRDAFNASDENLRKRGADLLWYLWLGETSPLFAKSKMATLELYLVEDKNARTEAKNPFYTLLESEATATTIFDEFGMDPTCSRIVVGHVPVKVKDGESPVKCGGKLIDIDGGMSHAYQATTGIGGFVLVKDEKGLRLGTLPQSDTTEATFDGSLDAIATWETL